MTDKADRLLDTAIGSIAQETAKNLEGDAVWQEAAAFFAISRPSA
jgi:hypothetical protein